MKILAINSSPHAGDQSKTEMFMEQKYKVNGDIPLMIQLFKKAVDA